MIDFGCGKSYLTFAMYYYLHEKKGFDLRITGLDLKEDVIAHCNALAEEFGYEKLKFLHGDIADYEGTDQVDLVVTLACMRYSNGLCAGQGSRMECKGDPLCSVLSARAEPSDQK